MVSFAPIFTASAMTGIDCMPNCSLDMQCWQNIYREGGREGGVDMVRFRENPIWNIVPQCPYQAEGNKSTLQYVRRWLKDYPSTWSALLSTFVCMSVSLCNSEESDLQTAMLTFPKCCFRCIYAVVEPLVFSTSLVSNQGYLLFS